MTEKDLIAQLKILKNVHPEQSWVDLTRSRFSNTNPQVMANGINIFKRIFAFPVPKMAAVPVMAAVVVLVGGIFLVQDANYEEGELVMSVRHKSLSVETKEELKEIASIASGSPQSSLPLAAGQADTDVSAVVFNEDGDAQESFKDALRNRIEDKIGRINDLFAQLEDGDLARDISLNLRRFEENFKLADNELGEQVKVLLADAEAALEEGNLIDALDLVNAIDKLLD